MSRLIAVEKLAWPTSNSLLDGDDERAFIIPALDSRSHVLNIETSKKRKKRFSNVLRLEGDKHLPLLHMICVFLVFLLKCGNGFSLSSQQAWRGQQPLPSQWSGCPHLQNFTQFTILVAQPTLQLLKFGTCNRHWWKENNLLTTLPASTHYGATEFSQTAFQIGPWLITKTANGKQMNVNKWFHSSRVKFPLVNMSASWFLVSIWFGFGNPS